jgi:hypothetical protein
MRSSPNSNYFVNRKPGAASKPAYYTDITARLWQVSADLVGMTSATL